MIIIIVVVLLLLVHKYNYYCAVYLYTIDWATPLPKCANGNDKIKEWNIITNYDKLCLLFSCEKRPHDQ